MKNPDIKLQQRQKLPTRKEVNALPHWIMLFSAAEGIDGVPFAATLSRRRQQLGAKKSDTTPLEIDLANPKSSHVIFASVPKKISAFELLNLSGKIIAALKKQKTGRVGIIIKGFQPIQAEAVAEALVAAACANAAEMPDYKSKKISSRVLKRLDFYGIKVEHAFKRTMAEAEGNALARYLSMLPPNELTPANYTQRIKKLSREKNWKLEIFDQKALHRKKAGAFLAVVQGSEEQDAAIVRLQHTPENSNSKEKVILVGKGICYDTGGTNLKPAKYMFGMHEDMQGSAVALGSFLALTQLKPDFPLECWLAIAMNHIGPKAYKPNDVITAVDGTTIEIVHTDAEGRMVLADTLALASEQKPALMIDYATLTGACVYSIGTAYSGVFTNQERFHPTLIEAGKDSGERVWPFPIDEDYDKGLASEIADVKQCGLDGDADHILAARFLQRFVKNNTPWVHMDLSSSNRKGGLAHIPTDTTGFGVRYTMNLLLDKKLQ
jgi:leucyl aminopeptidase